MKKKNNRINPRRLASFSIKNETGEKTLKIMMDTPDPLDWGLIQIAKEDPPLSDYQRYVAYERCNSLMKDINKIMKEKI